MASSGNSLLPVICCPNCWHEFAPDQLHFVSTGEELAFDHVRGAGQQRVFLPSSFTPNGDAIDPSGSICSQTACPKCHLPVPRLLAQYRSIAISVFGSPGSGKSFLLASMTHHLMQQIVHYGLTAEDADPSLNAIMRDYERELFNPNSPDDHVQLRKTQEVLFGGDHYNTINVRGGQQLLPKPFLYRVERYGSGGVDGRVLCLYDNAGESFEPGEDKTSSPVTRHMAKADVLMFVFDLTQEPAFRRACAERSADPQWRGQKGGEQAALFTEATMRIRNYKSMLPTDQIKTPLIVVLPKFDAWRFLLTDGDLPQPFKEVAAGPTGSARTLDIETVLSVGKQCRAMLQKYQPALVAKIENTFISKNIIYLPVSATGCSPTTDKPLEKEKPENPAGYGCFRAGDIRPIWAEMPLLASLKIAASKFLGNPSAE